MTTQRTWKVGHVTRSNAGGNLYNAVRTDTGAECPMEPSHDADTIGRRVDLLNAKPRALTVDGVRHASRCSVFNTPAFRAARVCNCGAK